MDESGCSRFAGKIKASICRTEMELVEYLRLKYVDKWGYCEWNFVRSKVTVVMRKAGGIFDCWQSWFLILIRGCSVLWLLLWCTLYLPAKQFSKGAQLKASLASNDEKELESFHYNSSVCYYHDWWVDLCWVDQQPQSWTLEWRQF